ncbi:hypothetical protein EAF00_011592 [Botryotinia globosa]|nr:hypothetical protein EAF00_011592 [Botryotinia globosa]
MTVASEEDVSTITEVEKLNSEGSVLYGSGKLLEASPTISSRNSGGMIKTGHFHSFSVASGMLAICMRQ